MTTLQIAQLILILAILMIYLPPIFSWLKRIYYYLVHLLFKSQYGVRFYMFILYLSITFCIMQPFMNSFDESYPRWISWLSVAIPTLGLSSYVLLRSILNKKEVTLEIMENNKNGDFDKPLIIGGIIKVANWVKNIGSNKQLYVQNNFHQTNNHVHNIYHKEIYHYTQPLKEDQAEEPSNSINDHQLQTANSLYATFNESWIVCSIDSFKAFLFGLPLGNNPKIKWVQTGIKKSGNTPNTELLCLFVIFLKHLDLTTITKSHYNNIIDDYFYIENKDSINTSDLYKIKEKIHKHNTVKDPYIEVLEKAMSTK